MTEPHISELLDQAKRLSQVGRLELDLKRGLLTMGRALTSLQNGRTDAAELQVSAAIEGVAGALRRIAQMRRLRGEIEQCSNG